MNKKHVTDAVKKLGMLPQAKQCWMTIPLLEDMAINFSAYTAMHAISESGKPLLCTALKDALNAYKAAGTDQTVATAAFTRKLLDYSADIFGQRIVVKTVRNDVLWNPFVSSLDDFLDAYPDGEVSASRHEMKVDPALAHTFMMIKTIPYTLLDRDSLNELMNVSPVEG